MPKSTREHHDVWIEGLLRTGVNMTPWEESFVESLQVQRALGRDLSDKQVEILERIYAQRTP